MSANNWMQGLQAALTERGVQDVKFFFNSDADTAPSHVAEDVAHVLNSYISGNVVRMEPIKDSVR